MLPDEQLLTTRWPRAKDIVAGYGEKLRILEHANELNDLYRLRYRRYVIEQGKNYDSMRDLNGLLTDPLDSVSLNIAETRAGKVGAAVRLCFLENVGHDDYLYPLVDLLHAQYGDSCMICSRFVIDPSILELRSTVRLFRAVYEVGLHHGGEVAALSTRPELLKTFGAFGYVATGQTFDHNVAGHQVVMVLHMKDSRRLHSVKSPLRSVLQRTMNEAT